MLKLPSSVRTDEGTTPVDMRKQIDGFTALVTHPMGHDARSDHLFIAFNRRGDIARLLFWDANGFCLVTKRLGRSTFRRPLSRLSPEQASRCGDDGDAKPGLGGHDEQPGGRRRQQRARPSGAPEEAQGEAAPKATSRAPTARSAPHGPCAPRAEPMPRPRARAPARGHRDALDPGVQAGRFLRHRGAPGEARLQALRGRLHHRRGGRRSPSKAADPGLASRRRPSARSSARACRFAGSVRAIARAASRCLPPPWATGCAPPPTCANRSTARRAAKRWGATCSASTTPLGELTGEVAQGDGYAGIDAYFKSADPPRRAGCMDRFRRRFVKALKGGHTEAAVAVSLIGNLYHVEAEARRDKVELDELSHRR